MTSASEAQIPAQRRAMNIADFVQRFGTLGIFVALVVVSRFWSDSFLTYGNVTNVLRQVAAGAGIMAVGMLFVILTRGIDLSVGSIAALGSVLTGYFMATSGFGLAPTLLLVVIAGAACGLFTGILVAYLRLPSFVISLAMMAVARGLALTISEGRPITLGDSGAPLVAFGSGFFDFGKGVTLPYLVVLMLAVYVVGGVVLSFTRFGRIITAIGSNEEAVRLSGIAVPRYVLAVYVISGALAAVAGIILASRSGIGTAQVGVGAELNVIAAVVIGGASLMGGRGGVVNTLLGALIMGIIGNIMNLAGVPGYSQPVYTGLIIVFAMLLQYFAGALKR